MKTFFLAVLTVLTSGNSLLAQDTLYVYKSGEAIKSSELMLVNP